MTVAERQKIEILRVLYLAADTLIFDEPTSYLNELESEQFFKVMKRLKESGKTIIFITHNAQDALAVSDKITILRNGVTVYSSKESKPSLRELTLMMAGQTQVFRKQFLYGNRKNLLKVENLTFRAQRRIIGPISFELKEGEILGLIGFGSSGAVELTEAMAGMRKTLNGKITFHGKDVTEKDIAERRKIGMGYIPQKKTQVGLSTKLSVAYNLIINKYKELSFLGWLKYKKIKEWSNQLIEEFEIKAFSPWQPVETLSGGNMQRIVIAREARSMPRLLIACDPTSGLDMRSTTFVHKIFLRLCEQGSSILIYSSDLDEILKICDRVLVIFKGKLMRELDNDGSLTKNELIEAILSNESRAELA
ncbi:MAG: ATP-binding cassette domain-containing protein [Pseudothermotoga sp.]